MELGDRSNKVLQLVVDMLDAMSKTNTLITEKSVRGSSCFRGNRGLVDMLTEIQRGRLFKAALDVVPRSAAVYALAVTEEPSAREYPEYLAGHGVEFYRKRAQVALKQFGRATYDEIRAKAESE